MGEPCLIPVAQVFEWPGRKDEPNNIQNRQLVGKVFGAFSSRSVAIADNHNITPANECSNVCDTLTAAGSCDRVEFQAERRGRVAFAFAYQQWTDTPPPGRYEQSKV